MDRRTFLMSSAGVALVALNPATGVLAADEPSEFHIAGVLAFSGAYGIIGKDMRQGVELAIADRGGKVLGKPIRVSWEDDETKPQPAVQTIRSPLAVALRKCGRAAAASGSGAVRTQKAPAPRAPRTRAAVNRRFMLGTPVDGLQMRTAPMSWTSASSRT